MSLRLVHVFFITSSIVLFAFFGYWGVHHCFEAGGSVNGWLGAGSSVLAVGMTLYLVWFVKKSRTGPRNE